MKENSLLGCLIANVAGVVASVGVVKVISAHHKMGLVKKIDQSLDDGICFLTEKLTKKGVDPEKLK